MIYELFDISIIKVNQYHKIIFQRKHYYNMRKNSGARVK